MNILIYSHQNFSTLPPVVSGGQLDVLQKLKPSCLIVAPHCVAERFIRHNPSFPIEKSQETFLHRLQLLLVHLREREEMMES